jgi:heat shock protein HtpX
MSIAAGLPMPKVYIIDDTAMNAFATGRNPQHASVAITKGLLMKLNRDELQGVMAHEMSHVKNRDILFMMMAGILLGAVALLADFFLRSRLYAVGGYRRRSSREEGGAQAVALVIAFILAILAPIFARLLYLACSRRREYLADASGAMLTRYPEGLASALEKISQDREVLEAANRATAPMYIVHPVKAFEERAAAMFSTHPPVEERIAILRSMGRSVSMSDYERAWRKYHAGEKFASASAIAAAKPVPARGPSQEVSKADTREERLRRAHKALDMVRRVGGFLFLPCACGTTLKIPPTFTREEVRCPRCGSAHDLSEARPA